jgi:hypothetical protein
VKKATESPQNGAGEEGRVATESTHRTPDLRLQAITASHHKVREVVRVLRVDREVKSGLLQLLGGKDAKKGKGQHEEERKEKKGGETNHESSLRESLPSLRSLSKLTSLF